MEDVFQTLWESHSIFCGYRIYSKNKPVDYFVIDSEQSEPDYTVMAKGYHCDYDKVIPVVCRYVGNPDAVWDTLQQNWFHLHPQGDFETLYEGPNGLYCGHNCDDSGSVAAFLEYKGISTEFVPKSDYGTLLLSHGYIHNDVYEWETRQDPAEVQEGIWDLYKEAKAQLKENNNN